MRRQLIAGNWKMYKTVAAAQTLVEGLRQALAAAPPAAEVVVCPPFTALHPVSQMLKGSAIRLGAQDVYWALEGAFTGEVAPPMLTDVGCTHVIIGHSERRQFFAETDETVAKKTRAALDHGLTPIVCVGERLEERDGNRTLEVVERQVERGFREVKPEEAMRCVIAYEPVWAIGTGRAATPEQAQEVHAFIRRLVDRSHGQPVAAALRILYGGSVKPDNAQVLLHQADIDGALVGGACLEAGSFARIIAAARA